MTTTRRQKWTPPPPQTPRILHLPRHTSRRKPPSVKPTHFLRPPPPPLVILSSSPADMEDDRAMKSGSGSGDVEERELKWRFESEMLRTECYFLRMEREVAVKSLEIERCFLWRSFNSAVNSLLLGKKKISEGENASSVLEAEIEELSKKLMDLQKRSSKMKSRDFQNYSNFDKQASELKKKLDEYNELNHGECCVEDGKDLIERRVRVYAGSNRRSIRPTDVETLRRKMERLSKGKLLKRMEEVYGSMLSAATNSSVSASSSRRYDLADSLSQSSQEAKSGELKACSGQCKAIVKRIMEQVKAETEQWSQMQEMLGQVREEMEELQASRDFWEARSLDSDHQIQNLHSQVEEWKQKTASVKINECKLEKQVQELQQELENSRVQKTCEPKVKTSKDSTAISLGTQLANEKRGLTCRIKQGNTTNENVEKKTVDYSNGSSRLVASVNRLPFKDIGNLSSIGRQNSRRYVYPLHNSQNSRV